ncbi:MAG: transketolase [Armatimonadota bacterium]
MTMLLRDTERLSEETLERLEALAKLIRYYSLTCSTAAGSGHPTSSLSATELMVGLLFGGVFRYDLSNPEHSNNDRIVFSKGHASPLYYSMLLAANAVSPEEIMSYRQFGSDLEGHPTPRFRYVEAATGSLGQGLSIGVGEALNARYLDKLPYRTYVLLGDSEMAEGSNWEAIELAAYYNLSGLIGIIDVNRLGQRGETMYGHNVGAYKERVEAFGWKAITIEGHDLPQVVAAYEEAMDADRPTMIIASTIKGKGVSWIEDKNGWHGKALDEEQLQQALGDLGPVDLEVRGEIAGPEDVHPEAVRSEAAEKMEDYPSRRQVATRDAYGSALKRIYSKFPHIVSLDGEVSNSTKAEAFEEAHQGRFFEMFITEQNMVGTAVGLQARGKIPFVSTFAAFFSRAFDQIRMAQYSMANIKFVGSHAGVSIGQDGPSQMGLEDIATFRTIIDSVVLHPCDAVSTDKLVEAMAEHQGISYLRTLREKTAVLYQPTDSFPIGGCKVLRQSPDDVATVVAAGVTVHEALKAYDMLQEDSIPVRVIDLYSIKPLDRQTLLQAARETGRLITVEDHNPEGGLGEAVLAALAEEPVPVDILAVRKRPMSGKPEELLAYEEIDAAAIVKQVRRKR